MGDEAGWVDWLVAVGQGLLLAVFLVFFYLAIRLCLSLARSGCAYNSPQSPEAGANCASAGPEQEETPFTDQGNRT